MKTSAASPDEAQPKKHTTASSHAPRYRVRPVTTPLTTVASNSRNTTTHDAATLSDARAQSADPFLRDEAEDDDGYDPFSDRPPTPEPTFQEDPWR